MRNVKAVPHGNNFDTLRALAALAVVVSHAFPLARGAGMPQPLHDFSHGQVDLGLLAVLVFFVISGYLITRSFHRSPNPLRFVVARALRIFPGLLVALTATAFLLGPFVTELELDSYLSSSGVILYVLDGATLFWTRYQLPGVFEDNPTPDAVNGSLWTLKYEFALYVVILLLGITRLLRASVAALLWVVLAVLSWRWIGGFFVQFALPFMGGATLYLWRERVPLNWRLAVASAVVLGVAAQLGGFRLAFGLFGAYLVIFLAVAPSVRLPNLGRYGDFSYGIYIYGYPVQQAAAFLLGPDSTWYWNAAVSLPVIIGLAALSWRFIERPALALKRPAARAAEAARS